MLDRCAGPTPDRRRHFWTTQPSACGEQVSCGSACGVPGLVIALPANCDNCRCLCGTLREGVAHNPECIEFNLGQQVPLTYATNDWVRSLLLNIFNTVARVPASACGNLPGRQGGHWSESYGDGFYAGTHMFESAPNASFREILALLNARIAKDAYKLVTYNVATAVDVVTTYLGQNRVAVTVTVTGPGIAADGVVNLNVQRNGNSWVWS